MIHQRMFFLASKYSSASELTKHSYIDDLTPIVTTVANERNKNGDINSLQSHDHMSSNATCTNIASGLTEIEELMKEMNKETSA